MREAVELLVRERQAREARDVSDLFPVQCHGARQSTGGRRGRSSKSCEQRAQLVFADDRRAELNGFVVLRARRLACEDVVGLLADRRGDLPAGLLDQCRRFFARERRQRPGQHEGLVAKRPFADRRHAFIGHVNAGLPQLVQNGAVPLLAEEVDDARADDLADAVDRRDVLRRRILQRIDRREVTRQDARGRPADVAYAEPRQKAGDRAVLRGLDRAQEVPRPLAGDHPAGALVFLEREPVELRELVGRQRVEVAGVLHPPLLDQLFDRLIPEPFDVHRAAPGEVEQTLTALRRTDERAGAVRNRFALLPHDRRAAEAARRRHLPWLEALLALRQDRSDDLGDDVSGAPHDDGVARAHVLARDLILVVQSGRLHSHPADVDGFEYGVGRRRPRPADIYVDVAEQRLALLRRVLVRDRPSRRLRRVAQLALLRRLVDLHHHAVDLVLEVVAVLLPVLDERPDDVERLRLLALGGRAEPGLLQRTHRLTLGLERDPLGRPDPVDQYRERPSGGHRGILLAQRAGRRVARVRERRETLIGALFVEPVEVRARHVHLAAHF